MNDAKTIGSNALVLDTAEENVTVMNAEESKLGKEVSLIEQRAEAVVVASGADFEDAGLFPEADQAGPEAGQGLLGASPRVRQEELRRGSEPQKGND